MEPLLVFPDPAPAVVAQALGLASYTWKAVGSLDEVEDAEPEDGWSGGVVCADELPDAAFGLCRSLRKRDVPFAPLLLLLSPQQLGALELREDLFDDFCATPCDPRELEARLSHLFWRTGRGLRPELVEYGPLVLNLETYQASVASQTAFAHLHGVRTAEVPGHPPWQGLHQGDAAVEGLGIRVLRGRTHGRRPRPALARQARRGARQPHIDGAVGRLQVRPEPLGALGATSATTGNVS